jgi:hypothetical protein
MNIQKKMLIILNYFLFVLALNIPAYAQKAAPNYIKSDLTIVTDVIIKDHNTMKESSDQKDVFRAIMRLTTDSGIAISSMFSEFVDPSTNDITPDCAVVLVRYARSRVNKSVTLYTKLNPIAITMDKKEYSSYILEKKNILLVFIDNAIMTESIKVKNKTSYFSNTLSGIIQIVKDTYFPSSGVNKAGFPTERGIFRFVVLDPKKIVPPSEISFAVPIQDKADKQAKSITTSATTDSSNKPDATTKPAKKDTVKLWTVTDDTPFDTVRVVIHEINHFAFSIGLNGSFVNKQDFRFSGDTISVKLDSAQKKQLSNSITMSLEWYPFGRDIDRFLPLWKDFKNIPQHLGISVGISLSKDPLQSYYAGVALCLTKEFNVVCGINFANTTTNDQHQITNISSVSDAEKYVLNRSYKGSFYIGISLSPSQAIKNLGL